MAEGTGSAPYADYHSEYDAAASDSKSFWAARARALLRWSKDFTEVSSDDFKSTRWFGDGELNACDTCVDRWVEETPDKTALIFCDNEGRSFEYTYAELQRRIFEVCHLLQGLSPGDCVTCYLSMSPEAIFTALACARLGIVHNFVFGGFAAESLREKIVHTGSRMVISQKAVARGAKTHNFQAIVEKAVHGLDLSIGVLIYDARDGAAQCEPAAQGARPASPARAEQSCSFISQDSICNSPVISTFSAHNFEAERAVRYWSQLAHSAEHVPARSVGAEHPLFYLYTSGTTGNPKGIIHTTGGYLTYAAYSMQMAFGIRRDDIFCSTADIGWITGHSYGMYAPLALGITSIIIEGIPSYPSPYRLFDIIARHRATHLYTAPTVVRSLKAYFEQHPIDTSPYDLSSLRLLGSVGEPIDETAHRWFSSNFNSCKIIDTYFQTETGGILIAPIPGAGDAPPCSAGFPMPGIAPVVSEAGEEAGIGELYIARPWPGVARGIFRDQDRWLRAYLSTGIYFTGDKARTTPIPCATGKSNAIYTLQGRADDEINVSGHRINTAEVEGAACLNEAVSEAAVVPLPHAVKGSEMLLFVVLKDKSRGRTQGLAEAVGLSVVQKLGGFCRPGHIVVVPDIPKTATGKIMRRVIGRTVNGQATGDLSTCTNPVAIDGVKKAWDDYRQGS
ncbi:acetyl-CoA synthetase [Pancytospora philotis]|nr:acetyl-CoA synthetase [Pancytospora philotis]